MRLIVTVRAQLMLSVLVAAAAAGFSQLPSANAEPLKVMGVRLSNPRTGLNSWRMTPVVFAGAAKAGAGQVASATRRLDLSKLTMADFGDVEQSR